MHIVKWNGYVAYWLALKRKEVLKHATMWMNLENIKLNKTRQSQNRNYMILLMKYLE